MVAQEKGHRINAPAQYHPKGEEGIRHPEFEEHDTPLDSLLFAEDPMTEM